MQKILENIPWSELAKYGPIWGIILFAVFILLWRSPQILAVILTHSREKKRINADIGNKSRRLELEIQAKMAKIERRKKGDTQ